MTRRGTWAVAACLVSLGACSDAGDLDGSLSDVYRLNHDQIRTRLYASELSIEYARDDGAVPVRVTLRVAEVELRAGGHYDLGEHGAITGQLEDGTEIPPFIDGELRLEDFGTGNGARVRGSFDATFSGSRDVLSLAGKFDTPLRVVDWPVRAEDGGSP